jgi:hypothetical protein
MTDLAAEDDASWRPSPQDRLLVLAGNYRQYVCWCAQHGINPRTDAVYVHQVDQLRERHRSHRVAVVGTFYEDRPREAVDIIGYLHTHGVKDWSP